MISILVTRLFIICVPIKFISVLKHRHVCHKSTRKNFNRDDNGICVLPLHMLSVNELSKLLNA